MKKILAVIVLSQFCCTSLWFAGNAVMNELAAHFHIPATWLPHLTSMVQLGFIAGTLVFALLHIADRYSPSRVFFTSAWIAAAINMMICCGTDSPAVLFICRFLCGFFLAGIYPVGMKIISDHYREGLGRSLGFLVGALVMGTALPHLLKGMSIRLPWTYVISITSVLAAAGGLAVGIGVPDGPYRQRGNHLDLSVLSRTFRIRGFRAAAFGYFGHMWELYTFWMLVPVFCARYQALHPGTLMPIPLLSFLIIASGAIACILSGFIAQYGGVKRTAAWSLALSGTCCLLLPLALHSSAAVFLVFMFTWGMTVIADSPLFSTLAAQEANSASRGTALTMMTCAGFAITIISIQLISIMTATGNSDYIYLLLAAGPAAGIFALIGSDKPAT